jgi:hypothetical protein
MYSAGAKGKMSLLHAPVVLLWFKKCSNEEEMFSKGF